MFLHIVLILRPGCGSVNICAVDTLSVFGDMAEFIKIVCTSKLLMNFKVLDQQYRCNIVFILLISGCETSQVLFPDVLDVLMVLF